MLLTAHVSPTEFFHRFDRNSATAFDLETFLITPTDKAPEPVCLSAAQYLGDERAMAVLLGADDIPAFLSAIEGGEGPLVLANAPFDLGVLRRWYKDAKQPEHSRVWDVQIFERLAQIAIGEQDSRVSLSRLAERYGSQKLDRGGALRTRFGELRSVPLKEWPPEMREYALQDAVATLAVFLGQARRVDVNVSEAERLFQQDAAFALHEISIRGMEIDPGLVEEMAVEWVGKINETKAKLKASGIIRNDKKQTKDLAVIRARVETQLGTSTPRTEKGAVMTDADTLRMTGDPELLELVELGKLSKLTSTYLPFMAEKSVHCGRWGLADTGRATSSDPNLQNIPSRTPEGKKIMSAFIARPGYAFVGADYPSCELRCLAHICYQKFGASNLREMLVRGEDPATWLAAKMVGTDYTGMSGSILNNAPWAIEARQRAKMAVYGFPGGMGIAKFIATARRQSNGKIIFTPNEAIYIKAAWAATFPEMEEYFNWIRRHEVGGGVYQMHSYGGKRLRGGMRFPEAANSQFQGLASDIGKAALVDINFCMRIGESGGLVAFVHDSIVVEAQVDRASSIATLVENSMSKAGQKYAGTVPWPIKAKVGSTWLEVK